MIYKGKSRRENNERQRGQEAGPKPLAVTRDILGQQDEKSTPMWKKRKNQWEPRGIRFPLKANLSCGEMHPPTTLMGRLERVDSDQRGYERTVCWGSVD